MAELKNLTVSPGPKGSAYEGHHIFVYEDGPDCGVMSDGALRAYLTGDPDDARRAPPLVGTDRASEVDREVDRRIRARMAETGEDYASACRRVTASDPRLAQRFRSAHMREGGDTEPIRARLSEPVPSGKFFGKEFYR